MRTKDSKAFVVAIPLKVSQFQQMRIGTLNMSQGTFIRGKQGLLASERHWHEPHWSRELWHTCPWSKKANKMCYLMSKMVFMQQHFGFECCNSSFSSWLNCGKASEKKKTYQQHSFFHKRPRKAIFKRTEWRKNQLKSYVCGEECWKSKVTSIVLNNNHFQPGYFLQGTQLSSCQCDRITGRFSLLS